MGRKPKSASVTWEQFVEAWESAARPADVGKTLGMTMNSVNAKASMLRRAGLPLKKFKRVGVAPNIEELMKILAKSQRKSLPELQKASAEMLKKAKK